MSELGNDQKSGKPKFQARKSVVQEARLRELDAFGGNPIPHSDYHLMLEDFIYMSIRRHGRPLPMLRLQGEILTDLIDAEHSVAVYKSKFAELESAKAPQEDQQYVKAEWQKYRRLRYALRDIGDGIAWRFLDFDRCVLSQLGQRSRKPHINVDGTKQELQELANVMNKNNEVALLNDLTNILKKGDVTAKMRDGSFEFIEVKASGARNRRMVRQKNDLQETLTFLNDGEMEHEEFGLLQIATLPISPQNYFSFFEKLLVRAEKEGIVTETIGEHLVLTIIDLRAGAEANVDTEPFFDRFDEVRRRWHERGDLQDTANSVDRLAHVQNFAPYSIFPIDYRFRAKLMTGAVVVNASLNVSAVLRYLGTRGWMLIKGPLEFAKEAEEQGKREIPYAAVKKGPLTIHLAPPVIGRLSHEYLSVKTLGDMLEEILKRGKNAADSVFTNFEGEALQWD